MTKYVTLTIDDTAVEVPEGTTVFNAAKHAGIEIPHFCYHPKLSIAGNCRLCQVEVVGVNKPVISCRETVREGMVVKVSSPGAVQVRKDVLEFILINHPLDCPVCDQSGECKLQDQYFQHSLQVSRMRLPKVEKPKATSIGPYVHLDDERCVLCTRCIRFCDEVVGSHELMLRERGDHSTIDVFPGKQLENPYSLCTVDLCPVGALTSSDFRFKKRVWFLKTTPSICTGCATGCNIWLDASDTLVYRYRPRDNDDVNECWMCDAGRMTYKQINSELRALFPLAMVSDEYQRITWDEAMKKTHALLTSVVPQDIIGVLSAQMSVEENMAFVRCLREAVGVKQFFWTGRKPMPELADKLLRDADRNPNAQGVQLIAPDRLTAQVRGKVFVVLDGLPEDEAEHLIAAQPTGVVLIADTIPTTQPVATILLPRATHVEQEGTFLNRQTRLQRFEKAFVPRGESLPVWSIAKKLAALFGKELPLDSAEKVFETEKRHYQQLHNIIYRTIPHEGVQL